MHGVAMRQSKKAKPWQKHMSLFLFISKKMAKLGSDDAEGVLLLRAPDTLEPFSADSLVQLGKDDVV
jgi:hypothetical protein